MRRFLIAVLGLLVLAGPAWAQMSPKKVVRVTGYPSVDVVRPGDTFQIAVVLDIAPGYHMNAHKPSNDSLIPTDLSLQPADNIQIDGITYPAAQKITLAMDPAPLDVYTGRAIVLVNARAIFSLAPGTSHLSGTLHYQACNDQACLPPVKIPFTVDLKAVAVGSSSHPANSEYFQPTSVPSPAVSSAPPKQDIFFGASPPGESVTVSQSLSEYIAKNGLILALLGVFLQGLLLNLTPCVYPLIPITISFFGGQAQGQPRKTFLLSCTYVVGLATTYSLLGVAAATTGRLFGSTLQNPYVLAGVSVVFFALSLSMLGAYEITVPSAIASKVESKKGYMGALFMGLFVGIVAAPCVGPFVVSLVTYVGAKGDPVLGFWMFFTLAMGLGLPFLILGWFSGSTKALPRSGAWMVWVKKGLGLIMMGMAVFYLRSLMGEAIFRWAMPAFIVLAGIWFGFLEGTRPRGRPVFTGVKYATGLVTVLIGVLMLVSASRPSPSLTWQPFAEPTLQAASSSKTPVIIDFSADWCVDCQLLEKKVYTDPSVVRASQNFVVMKADLTRADDPEVKKLMEQFRIKGLPTVVFLGADGKEIDDLRLTGYEAPAQFLQRMQKVAGPKVIWSTGG